MTRCFIPCLWIAILTDAYMIHQTITVHKTFPYKSSKNEWVRFDFIWTETSSSLPLGKGFLCACSLIFTTSRGVTVNMTKTELLLYSYILINRWTCLQTCIQKFGVCKICMFLKDVSYDYHGCIYLIKNTQISTILKYNYNLQQLFSIWIYFKI